MTARENDELRSMIPAVAPPDLLVLSRGVAALPEVDITVILQKIRDFDEFDEANDPWENFSKAIDSLHDFGRIEHDGKTIFWKIDDYGSQKGYDLMLTVMLAEEYWKRSF